MSNAYQQFKEGKGNRDIIFNEVLSLFNQKPINILEIGATRDRNGRAGDGFSTFFFAEYVKSFGRSLTVCDIDPNALTICKELLGDYFQGINYYLGSGLSYLKANPTNKDLILLDGSDNPQDMLDEYEAARADYILCDDFSTKGVLLRQKYPYFKLYKWHGYGHEVALYGKDINKEVVYLHSIL